MNAWSWVLDGGWAVVGYHTVCRTLPALTYGPRSNLSNARAADVPLHRALLLPPCSMRGRILPRPGEQLSRQLRYWHLVARRRLLEAMQQLPRRHHHFFLGGKVGRRLQRAGVTLRSRHASRARAVVHDGDGLGLGVGIDRMINGGQKNAADRGGMDGRVSPAQAPRWFGSEVIAYMRAMMWVWAGIWQDW